MKEEIISWINREINLTIQQNKVKERYALRFGEGYLLALKRVQEQFRLNEE